METRIALNDIEMRISKIDCYPMVQLATDNSPKKYKYCVHLAITLKKGDINHISSEASITRIDQSFSDITTGLEKDIMHMKQSLVKRYNDHIDMEEYMNKIY